MVQGGNPLQRHVGRAKIAKFPIGCVKKKKTGVAFKTIEFRILQELKAGASGSFPSFLGEQTLDGIELIRGHT